MLPFVLLMQQLSSNIIARRTTNCDNTDPGEPTIPVISDISLLEGSLDKLMIPFKSKISSPNEPPISFKFR